MIIGKKEAGRDLVGFLLLGLSLCMLGKSLMLCFSKDIWYDELFTVGMIEHSYGELVRFTAADVHPPLYYCIVKFFVDLCKLIAPEAGTVIPAKIVSVLPYFILLLYAVTLIRKRFGLFVSGLFLFCVTAMPQLSAYTVEARMYGWALLFVTAAFLHAGELTQSYVNQKNTAESGRRQMPGAGAADSVVSLRDRYLHAAAFVLYSLAAAYTQYFAAAAAGMVYLYLLLVFLFRDRKRIREWLLCAAAAVIGYAPWLSALIGQLGAVRENYWILPLTWRSLGGCVKFVMKPAFADDRVNTVLAVILFAACCLLWCVWAIKLYHNGRVLNMRFWFATAGVGVLGGVVAFGFAASFLLRPVFVYRYMIPALGCFWLAFALCLNEILCKPEMAQKQTDGDNADESRNRLNRGAGAVLTALIVIIGLRDYRAFQGEEEYKAVCMRETQRALALIGAEDTVLYNFDQVQAVTGYYLPETTKRLLWRAEGEKLIQEITSPCGTAEDVEKIRKLALEAQAGGESKNLWFIGSFNSRDEIVEEWRDAGLTVEEQGSFLLERYWFNLYKIS
ncbi:MAG: hypothetical protein NC302_10730 [Bacteroidales bacterium]|nr:hypothetical protein [Bacteroidales bacterium]MCM1415080.1 hypothetical protein [bacterium]